MHDYNNLVTILVMRVMLSIHSRTIFKSRNVSTPTTSTMAWITNIIGTITSYRTLTKFKLDRKITLRRRLSPILLALTLLGLMWNFSLYNIKFNLTKSNFKMWLIIRWTKGTDEMRMNSPTGCRCNGRGAKGGPAGPMAKHRCTHLYVEFESDFATIRSFLWLWRFESLWTWFEA